MLTKWLISIRIYGQLPPISPKVKSIFSMRISSVTCLHIIWNGNCWQTGKLCKQALCRIWKWHPSKPSKCRFRLTQKTSVRVKSYCSMSTINWKQPKHCYPQEQPSHTSNWAFVTIKLRSSSWKTGRFPIWQSPCPVFWITTKITWSSKAKTSLWTSTDTTAISAATMWTECKWWKTVANWLPTFGVHRPIMISEQACNANMQFGRIRHWSLLPWNMLLKMIRPWFVQNMTWSR